MGLEEHYDYYPANWSTSRGGHGIAGIVAHGTAGVDSRAYLQRGGDLPDGRDRKVSVHSLIDREGRDWRFVDDSRAANHAGFSTLVLNGRTYSPNGVSVNWVTLGLELENRQDGHENYTEVQLLSMGRRVNHWRSVYGQLPIVRHGDIDPTRRSDPLRLSVADIEAWCVRAASQAPTHPAGRPMRVIEPLGARLRAAPSTTSSVLAILDEGALVQQIGQADGRPPLGQRDRRWFLVMTPGGQRGYIWSPLLGGVS